MTSFHHPNPHLGHGLGLRAQHIPEILENRPPIDWFEVVTENYLGTRGIAFENLLEVRNHYPLALHGVTLSIGSADPFDQEYLRAWKELIQIIDPVMISDHLCWTHINGHHSHDLLPLPQTFKVIKYVVDRVDQIQNFLGQPILLENASTYVAFKENEMPEWEFLSEIAQQSGCGIVLDINNIFVNAFNYKFNPTDYLQAINPEKVGYLHLAGHLDRKTYLFDTHGAPMAPKTWDLYAQAIRKIGPKPTIVEWDNNIPDLQGLMSEQTIAREIEQRVSP